MHFNRRTHLLQFFFSYFLLLILHLSAQSQAQADTIPSPQTGFFTSFDSTKIYYERFGSGKPVLLIHGFTGSGASWRKTPLLKQLVAEGFEVVTVDLRGNGKSDKPKTDNEYANDAEAKDLIGLMSFLRKKQYDVVGYSRGSIITARLLVLDARVHKAVLGGMGDGFTNPQWPRRLLFYHALSGEPVPELAGFMTSARSRGLDTVQLAWQQKHQPSTLPSALQKVKQPVLLLNGDEDHDNDSPQALAAMFQKAQLRTVKGNHNTAASSEAFATEVVNYLK